METLKEFRNRTGQFNQSSLPIGGTIQPHERLNMKVTNNGEMQDYYGNTVIFKLPDDIKKEILLIQEELYKQCKDILAVPLKSELFHITLHDLINGGNLKVLEDKIQKTGKLALERVKVINQEKLNIKLKSTYLFNLVSRSMVLGFEPVDEESCQKLMALHESFQSIVHLNYPLTPHVTLAYFIPNKIINAEQIDKLQSVIDFVKAREPINVLLEGSMLEYKTFSSMNSYH